MIRRPPRSTQSRSSAASDVYKRQVLTAIVWPGLTHFVDWTHPNATKYWSDMLTALHMILPFDGLWIDMNEPSSFCDGECPDWKPPRKHRKHKKNHTKNHSKKNKSKNKPEHCPAVPKKENEDNKKEESQFSKEMPYVPLGLEEINTKTISLDAVHYDGWRELEWHSLFGLMQTAATHSYFQTAGNRQPFILSRSTAFGTGRIGFHWTGDNGSSFKWLRVSIPHLFSLNFFGIPFVGADICGFIGDTDPQLCARWIQIGALYPFARNHNDWYAISQELYALGDTVLEASRANLRLRYSLLKHYYTLFLKGRGTGTIFRPVFFSFPDDEILYVDSVLNEQFMIGEELMATPAVYRNTSLVIAYFPEDRWYSFYDGSVWNNGARSRLKRLSVPLEAKVPLFLRGGYIIPKQSASKVRRIDDLNDCFKLVVALKPNNDKTLGAQGVLAAPADIFDENLVTNDCVEGDCLLSIVAKVSGDNLTLKVVGRTVNSHISPIQIISLRLYGLPKLPSGAGDALVERDGKQEKFKTMITRFPHYVKLRFEPPISTCSGISMNVTLNSVSYTHLTLPTIYSV
eukprot:TRINITY_DN4475_c0_g1_i5.p1 TRINITY_DN4475_c0_g1~~TRINITY_DN4475_c0_g1_i5.p1  ORF type:complete len:572 (+),score=92.43 TRINITY_DN4475_c0_g1_i5:38-1753(+)